MPSSQKSADNGIDVFRVFDAMNDLRNLRTAIEAVKAAGKHAQGTICYTTSPVHDITQFVAHGPALDAMGCDTIAIKDMAGLLTPYATGELVAREIRAVAATCPSTRTITAGMAHMCQLKAIETGATTSIPRSARLPKAPATPPPKHGGRPRRHGIRTGLDLQLLEEIVRYFKDVRKKY